MEQKQTQVFQDFSKQPVQVITLDDLRRTHLENYPDGTPVGDIYHCDFFDALLEMLNKAGLEYELKEVFAANNKFKRSPGVTILPEVEKRDGVGSVSSHILRRVFANITLKNFGTEVEGYNIAVSYTQLGIIVGFGPMVYACHNQTICRAENIISNYTFRGAEKLKNDSRKLSVMMTLLKAKIAEIGPMAEQDFMTVARLKNILFTPDLLTEFLGYLTAEHARFTSANPLYRSSGYPPLTSAQINAFAERMLPLLTGEAERTTAWDVLNAANFTIKPASSPFENIAPQAYALMNSLKGLLMDYGIR
jgi:hypothetical protein